MPMSIEPQEIAEARELLKEFEKSPGLSKKSCFSEAIEILNDFLPEHPYSEFSGRVDNLKSTYAKLLIKRLGATPFSRLDWVETFMWVFRESEFSSEIEKFLESNHELKSSWTKFINFHPPWTKELIDYFEIK